MLMVLDSVNRLAAVFGLAVAIASIPAGAETLGFSQMRDRVLELDQGLQALTEEQAAARQAVRQASAYANPEIEVETEDFGRAEVGVLLAQPVLLGGRRGAATAVARLEARMADLRLASGRISVEAELIRRLVPILSTRRRLELIDSLLTVSTSGVEAVRRLVEAGAAMEIDMLRAELDRDELVLQRAALRRALAEAGVKLNELWGGSTLESETVKGSLPLDLGLPDLQGLRTALERHPDSQLLDMGVELIEAEVTEARAEAWPELTLSAGYLRNNEDEEGAAIAGASFSLPLFNRNKGAVAQRRHEMSAAKHGARRERLKRSAELTTLYSEIEGTAQELSVLSGDVLARAIRIHDTLEEFYMEGKTGILDVLEARGHLLGLQMRIVDLAEQQALLAADLLELTGHPIEIIR
jgi:cobalt-zinc-cadmium efflux system outer membrane protein